MTASIILQSKGDYANAEVFITRSLNLCEEPFPPSDPRIAPALVSGGR